MFETEAGFAETKMLINCNGDYSKKQDYKKGWQDGAEFGYNKAKEEMQEQGLALQSDMDKTIEQNIALKKELNKANEWHYVKDELPELYKDVLVVFPQGECNVKYLTKHNEWVGRGSWCSLTDVIAWKEIELPKEIKE